MRSRLNHDDVHREKGLQALVLASMPEIINDGPVAVKHYPLAWWSDELKTIMREAAVDAKVYPDAKTVRVQPEDSAVQASCAPGR
jgi:hypothetical protein